MKVLEKSQCLHLSNSPSGRRASVTSETGSFSSLWWDTCGESLEHPDEKENGTAKVKSNKNTKKIDFFC